MNAIMLITFLLVVKVGCDWIEITQQYQRNPIKLTPQYTQQTKKPYEKEVYTNHSITEHQWYKKPTDVATDLRTKGHPLKNGEHYTDSTQQEYTGNVKIISHPGKVDRVQNLNKPVKSSAVNIKPEITRNDEDKLKNELESPYRRISYNNLKTENNINTETTKEITFDYNDKHISKYENRNYTKSKLTPLITDVKALEETVNSNRFHRIPEIKSQSSEEIFISTKREPISSILNQKRNNALISRPLISNADNEELITNKNITVDNAPEYISSNIEKENDAEYTKEEPLPTDEKANATEVIIQFVKLVSETILSHTRRGFKSKLRYLEDLKNNLIANIGERIEATWPDNDNRVRRSRATEGSSRGHLEFPSSETTLMSISFLTFAVFLIKLVLQVIQTYKNKSMMVAPLVVATAGRAALNRLQNNHN